MACVWSQEWVLFDRTWMSYFWRDMGVISDQTWEILLTRVWVIATSFLFHHSSFGVPACVCSLVTFWCYLLSQRLVTHWPYPRQVRGWHSHWHGVRDQYRGLHWRTVGWGEESNVVHAAQSGVGHSKLPACWVLSVLRMMMIAISLCRCWRFHCTVFTSIGITLTVSVGSVHVTYVNGTPYSVQSVELSLLSPSPGRL